MLKSGSFSGPFIDLGGSFIRRATVAQQGGLLNGVDPTYVSSSTIYYHAHLFSLFSAFVTSDPFRLWAIQLGASSSLIGLQLPVKFTIAIPVAQA